MPRGNDIPEGIRATVVDLHKAGKGYKFISNNLGIHHSTVRKIIHKWKRFDTVATLPRSGRPTKNTPVKARRRRSQAGPADDGGGDPDEARCLFASPADVAAEDPEREQRQYGSTSCDETEENPTEEISDANFSGEKKIYPGSSLTMGTLILLFQTFILKHDLSKAVTKDLLDLLNLVVPGCIPTSLEFCYIPNRRC